MAWSSRATRDRWHRRKFSTPPQSGDEAYCVLQNARPPPARQARPDLLAPDGDGAGVGAEADVGRLAAVAQVDRECDHHLGHDADVPVAQPDVFLRLDQQPAERALTGLPLVVALVAGGLDEVADTLDRQVERPLPKLLDEAACDRRAACGRLKTVVNGQAHVVVARERALRMKESDERLASSTHRSTSRNGWPATNVRSLPTLMPW